MRCYNIGCKETFDTNGNKADSCRFHLKLPTFHDGLKGWECCNKFSTDFSTCLNTPGCQIGYHNSEKPLEQPKPQLDTKYNVDVVVVEPPRPAPKPERSSENDEMVLINVREMPSLRPALEARKAQLLEEAKKDGMKKGDVQFGTRCNNTGCNATYIGSQSNGEICMYHNGDAIFHEGMKFWSCCNRKTTEFDSFMAQEGCTQGTHLWFKERPADCRIDWFQTPSAVTLTFYVRTPVPETVVIRANGVRLVAKFSFDGGAAVFERSFTLGGVIDPVACSVVLGAAKIEVVLKKRDTWMWGALELPPASI